MNPCFLRLCPARSRKSFIREGSERVSGRGNAWMALDVISFVIGCRRLGRPAIGASHQGCLIVTSQHTSATQELEVRTRHPLRPRHGFGCVLIPRADNCQGSLFPARLLHAQLAAWAREFEKACGGIRKGVRNKAEFEASISGFGSTAGGAFG